VPQFLTTIFTTPRGWALIIGGAVVGATFGWIVLAISVVSMPMLVDSDVTAAEAVSASWRAAHENRNVMIRWFDRPGLAGDRSFAVRRACLRN
jgi:uncharacterized membrane protein